MYTPRNQFLIDLFGITDTEQRHLKTIIGRQEKGRRETIRKSKPEYKEAERKREKKRSELKRRAAGAKPREEYLQTADEKRKQAMKLSDQGKSQREIAVILGVSRGAVQNYLKEEMDARIREDFKAFLDKKKAFLN